MNTKKKLSLVLGIILIIATISGSIIVVNAEEYPYPVISTNINVTMTLPENVSISNSDSVTFTSNPVTFDHNGYTRLDASVLLWYVEGNTQAKQGNINLDSYTRARWEQLLTGRIFGDSDRQWSKNCGKSYATSGSLMDSAKSSNVGKTYYGIMD